MADPKSEERLIVDRAPKPMLVVDPTGPTVVHANPAAADLYGYPVEELIGSSLERLRPPQDVDVLRTHFSTVDLSREVLRYGIRHRRRDGSTFRVTIRAYPIEVGGRLLRVVHLEPESAGTEARQRQALLFQGIREAVIFTDAEGVITDWNPAAERLWGYERSEAVGRTAQFLHLAGGRDRVQALLTAVREQGVWEGELRTRTSDGAARICEVRVLAIQDEEGGFAGTVGINRDITEQRRAERALMESADELRAVADQLPHILWVAASDGVPTFHNRRSREYTGWGLNPPEDEVRMALVHPDDRAETRRAWMEAEESGVEGVVEHRLRNTDGAYRWHATTWSPVVDEQGEVRQWIGTSIDIHEKKLGEDTIRRREEYFRGLFQHAHDALLLFERSSGRILDANPQADELYDYPPGGLLGRSIFELYEDRTAMDAWLRELDEAGHGSGILVQHDRHGKRMQVETNAAYMNHEDRRVVLAINRDITERRLLEDRLQRAEMLEAVGRLAGGIAHDFNNLTTAIQGFASLLEERVAEDRESADAVAEIQNAAERAADLTRELLAYTRQQVMRGEILDLNEVVLGTRGLLDRIIGDHISVERQLCGDPCMARADRGQITRALMNLAVNARDAMPDGGHLSLQTRNVELDEVFAAEHPPTQPGRYVRIRVSDTGHGMAEDVRAHAFDPFFTTKEVGEGTGLGLATVYGIVKQSGGYIWVESEEGAGTTFDLYLPRIVGAAAEASAPEEAAAPESAGGAARAEPTADSGRTILLVEDEGAVRKLARRVLQRAGFDVIEAEDGLEALELVESTSGTVDLVLTDMVMPRMGGKELARRLSEAGHVPSILFMTGYSGETLAELGDLARGEAVLEKPFSPEELVTAVRGILQGDR